jgi:hypothetical protein
MTQSILTQLVLVLAFAMDQLSISAGWESATQNGTATNATTCLATAGALSTDTTGLVGYETSTDGVAIADAISGADICGDQTLMMFGGAMSAGELALNAGYSKLDSEEADKTTMNVGLGMDVGSYALSLNYVDSTKTYLDTAVSDKQTVIEVGASTTLGDGVDLGLTFSNNSYNFAGTGAHTNYRAGAELKITY